MFYLFCLPSSIIRGACRALNPIVQFGLTSNVFCAAIVILPQIVLVQLEMTFSEECTSSTKHQCRRCKSQTRFSTMSSETFCLPTSHTGQIKCLNFSPSGNLLASAAADGSVAVWSFLLNKQLFVHFFDADVAFICWHQSAHDKGALICGFEDGGLASLSFSTLPMVRSVSIHSLRCV